MKPTTRIVLPAMLVAAAIVALGLSAIGGGPPTGRSPRLALDEQFSHDRLDTGMWSTCHWWAPRGCTIGSNDELQWYTAEGVRVRRGKLRLTAERADGLSDSPLPYRSGMVSTGPQRPSGKPKFALRYGRVAVRLKVPEGRGLWPAVWLLPADTTSRPEIDILEVLGDRPGRWIFHLHPAARSKASLSHSVRQRRLGTGFHEVSLDWQPGLLVWSVDGDEVWRVSGPEVPDERMYLVMNLAVGGVYPGRPGADTRFPATFTVDRVRVWT